MSPITPTQLQDYYRSIERPFEETEKLEVREGEVGFFKPLFVVGLMFSLMPLIPWGLSAALPRVFGPRVLTIWSFRFSISSFWFLWPAAFGFFLVMLILAFALGRPSEELRSRQLSPAHMRFAYCYGVEDELNKYQTNRLERHLQNAQHYLDKLSKSLLRLIVHDVFIGFPEERPRPLDEAALPSASIYSRNPIRHLTQRMRWFKLEPQTEKILSAFFDIRPKLEDRLNDKKDLSTATSALTDLAAYLYTEIPEICEGTEEEKRLCRESGDVALRNFADKLNALLPYKSEVKPVTPQEAVSRKLVSTGSKLAGLFADDNVLICFLAWYVLSLTLIGLGFWLAFRFVPSLRLDPVIVSTIVGAPVAGAITAVTIARLGRSGRPPSKPETESSKSSENTRVR